MLIKQVSLCMTFSSGTLQGTDCQRDAWLNTSLSLLRPPPCVSDWVLWETGLGAGWAWADQAGHYYILMLTN